LNKIEGIKSEDKKAEEKKIGDKNDDIKTGE